MTTTIGGLTNVPAPGDPIRSPWAQDVTKIARHVFATKAALDAATPGWVGLVNGAHAYAVAEDTEYWRVGGAWITAVARGAWLTYTPTYSGGVGNGTLTGRWKAIDARTVVFMARIDWGTTTSHGAGTQALGTPVAMEANPLHGLHGSVDINQGGTARKFHPVFLTGTTVTGADQNGVTISNTGPVTPWVGGHYWSIAGTYQSFSTL